MNPRIRMLWLGLSIFCLCLSNVLAQHGELDLRIEGNQKRVDIPFQLINNFIVVPVLIDNLLPVNFIVDTGAEHTIILDRTLTDAINARYQRVFEIVGSDLSTSLQALLAVGIDFKIGTKLTAKNRSVLVLSENNFNFEELTGVPIAGILGGDFLMRFVLEIDYHRRVLRLHEPSNYQPGRRHEQLPAQFERNRAYLEGELVLSGQRQLRRLLLIDTGASLSLLLLSKEEEEVQLPDETILAPIANGLGGQLMGMVGRARNFSIGKQDLGAMVLFYQDMPPFMDSLNVLREGIIGNRALQRFNLIIDYPRRAVYARPVGRWPRSFPFDRSGLIVSAGGPHLTKYQVLSVIENSPAAEAGLEAGDIIRRLNGTPGPLLTLNGINRKLEGRVGKRIKILAERDGLLFHVEFYLRDLI